MRPPTSYDYVFKTDYNGDTVILCKLNNKLPIYISYKHKTLCVKGYLEEPDLENVMQDYRAFSLDDPIGSLEELTQWINKNIMYPIAVNQHSVQVYDKQWLQYTTINYDFDGHRFNLEPLYLFNAVGFKVTHTNFRRNNEYTEVYTSNHSGYTTNELLDEAKRILGLYLDDVIDPSRHEYLPTRLKAMKGM